MRHSSPGVGHYLRLGVIQGWAAWSAYAVIEFLFSSVLFRLSRPYARFTTWHWTLTGQLVLAYMAAGAVLGALAGLVIFLLRKSPRLAYRPIALTLEHAAALTLTLAIVIQLAVQPAAPDIWWKLLAIPLVLADLLVLAIYTKRWSTRFGLLTNPWVIAGLFLSGGQVSALQFMGVAQQLGISIQPWYFILLGLQLLAACAAVWIGQRWRQACNPDRIFAPNWVAGFLAAGLMMAGFALGTEPRSAPPHAAIAGSSTHPNVILIVMDTTRADHLSPYGYSRNTTPNLQKLAADGTVYLQALSAADVTLTSHASIFSGLYASWHGAYCQPPQAVFGRPMRPVPTMAEILGRNGYHTLGVAANLYLRSAFGLQRGFQQFHLQRPVPVLAAESWYMLRNGMRRVIGLFADTSQFDRLFTRGDAVNQEFFSLLGQPSLAKAPFFAFLNYMDAHFPYIPPKPYDRLFPGKDRSLTEAKLAAVQHDVEAGKESLPGLYTRHSISQYDGSIAYIDAQLGQLVGWLKREKLYDNTMIVVTADHGESFGERRLFEHGNSLYANLLHVGLVVKYPYQAHTGQVSVPVSLIDILPTVLRAAGVTPPAGLQGVDLLDPAASQPRNLFSESFPCPVMHGPACPGGCTMRAVVSWPNKYIFSSNGRSEVYQLQQDPNETRNLFGLLGPTAQTLATQLNAWIKTMPQLNDHLPGNLPMTGSAFQGEGPMQTAAGPRPSPKTWASTAPSDSRPGDSGQ